MNDQYYRLLEREAVLSKQIADKERSLADDREVLREIKRLIQWHRDELEHYVNSLRGS